MADLAVPAIGIVMDALADVFDPAGPEPPSEGSTDVHFFAGEGPVEALYIPSPSCTEPFLWVRMARRYRTRGIPEIAIEQQPCALPRAVAVEIGVGRCAVAELNDAGIVTTTWAEYDAEGMASLDDSWRIEGALCLAAKRLMDADYAVVTEEVIPVGPEGGLIAWTGMIHIQFQ